MDQPEQHEERAGAAAEGEERDNQREQPQEEGDNGEHTEAERAGEQAQATGGVAEDVQVDNSVDNSAAAEGKERDNQREQPQEEGDNGEHTEAEHAGEQAQAAGGEAEDVQVDNGAGVRDLPHNPHQQGEQAAAGVQVAQLGEEEVTEQESLIHKLANIPVFVHGMKLVWNRYEEVKTSNMLFDLTLDMAEFTAHLFMAVAGPCVYERFQSCIDKADYCCCFCVDSMQVVLPELRLPAKQAMDYLRGRVEGVKAMAEPVTRPIRNLKNNPYVKAARLLCKPAVKVGKGAWRLGCYCAKGPLWPVKLWFKCVYMSMALGLRMMDGLADYLRVEQRVADPSNQVLIESIENVLFLLLPTCSQHRPQGQSSGRRVLTSLAQRLAEHIHDTQGDGLRALKLLIMLVFGLILKLIAAGVTLVLSLSRLTTQAAEALRGQIHHLWDSCIELFPDFMPKETLKDPLGKASVLLVYLVRLAGNLLVQAMTKSHTCLQMLSEKCQSFVEQFLCLVQKYTRGVPSQLFIWMWHQVAYILELVYDFGADTISYLLADME